MKTIKYYDRGILYEYGRKYFFLYPVLWIETTNETISFQFSILLWTFYISFERQREQKKLMIVKKCENCNSEHVVYDYSTESKKKLLKEGHELMIDGTFKITHEYYSCEFCDNLV